MIHANNASISEEILSQVACQHRGCGKPLTECDGSSHYAQAARHNTLCPLCNGAAHNNDSKGSMALVCAMRQALAEKGLKFDAKSDRLNADDFRTLAAWLDTPGRQYGKDAAAQVLMASGVTGISAAKVGKRASVAPPPVVPPTVSPPPTAPAAPVVPPPVAPKNGAGGAHPVVTVAAAPVVDDDEFDPDAAFGSALRA